MSLANYHRGEIRAGMQNWNMDIPPSTIATTFSAPITPTTALFLL
jgi:hypothetical protein